VGRHGRGYGIYCGRGNLPVLGDRDADPGEREAKEEEAEGPGRHRGAVRRRDGGDRVRDSLGSDGKCSHEWVDHQPGVRDRVGIGNRRRATRRGGQRDGGCCVEWGVLDERDPGRGVELDHGCGHRWGVPDRDGVGPGDPGFGAAEPGGPGAGPGKFPGERDFRDRLPTGYRLF